MTSPNFASGDEIAIVQKYVGWLPQPPRETYEWLVLTSPINLESRRVVLSILEEIIKLRERAP